MKINHEMEYSPQRKKAVAVEISLEEDDCFAMNSAYNFCLAIKQDGRRKISGRSFSAHLRTIVSLNIGHNSADPYNMAFVEKTDDSWSCSWLLV